MYRVEGPDAQPRTFLATVGPTGTVHRVGDARYFQAGSVDAGLKSVIVNGFARRVMEEPLGGQTLYRQLAFDFQGFAGVDHAECRLVGEKGKIQISKLGFRGHVKDCRVLCSGPGVVVLSCGQFRVLVRGEQAGALALWVLSQTGRSWVRMG